MDAETRTYLQGMEERLFIRIDSSLDERLKKLESHLEERFFARIEKAETNLLRAFHGWSRSMEVRQRGTTAPVSGFDERMTFIEERVGELERRNLPH